MHIVLRLREVLPVRSQGNGQSQYRKSGEVAELQFQPEKRTEYFYLRKSEIADQYSGNNWILLWSAPSIDRDSIGPLQAFIRASEW